MSNNTIHSPEELLPGEGEALTWEEASEYGLTIEPGIDPVEAAEATRRLRTLRTAVKELEKEHRRQAKGQKL